MIYDTFNRQPICETFEEYALGSAMASTIVEQLGVSCVDPGTIFVFDHPSHYSVLMFQCLDKVSLLTKNELSLMYYISGSVINTRGDIIPDSRIPTFRFQWCRFPNNIELKTYLNSKTV